MEEDDEITDELDDLSGRLLYKIGLKLFDHQEYQEALKYFK